MTEPPHDREALDAARGLTGALQGVGRELARLNAYGRRSRHLIWLTVAGLAVDVVLTAVIAAVAVAAHTATDQARHATATVAQLHQTTVQGCQAGNSFRAGTVALWDHLAAGSKPAPGSTAAQVAAQKKAVAKFLAYVSAVNKPRNCRAAYRLP